jgi:hypothetical protein
MNKLDETERRFGTAKTVRDKISTYIFFEKKCMDLDAAETSPAIKDPSGKPGDATARHVEQGAE